MYSYQECEEYIRNISQRIPVLRTRQLARALYKLSPAISSTTEAMMTLQKVQRKGYLLLSPDGFAITRGAYSIATNDRLLSNLNTKIGEYAIPRIGQKLQEKRLITNATDCFWFACDFLPYSYEFIANLTPPWAICFDAPTSSGHNKLYQVTKIKRGETYQTIEKLKVLPNVPEQDRDGIVRIAVLEDPNERHVIPPLGFKFICKIDETAPRGYKILEKREGNQIWG